MAVISKLKDLLAPVPDIDDAAAAPAPPTTYRVAPLREEHLEVVSELNMRCFPRGEQYSKYTFRYLLTEAKVLSFQAVTAEGEMAGFIVLVASDERIAHITTIGVAPEHRRRGIARMLIERSETALAKKGFNSLMLEVRVSNAAAQDLYSESGYSILQRVRSYYSNGEDAFLMSKVLPSNEDDVPGIADGVPAFSP